MTSGRRSPTRTSSGRATSVAGRVGPLRPLRHRLPPGSRQDLGRRPPRPERDPALSLRAVRRGDRRHRDRGRGVDRRAPQAGRRDLPGAALAEMCLEAGADFALSSDAHAPDQVGFGYDQALEFSPPLGVERICVFEGRQRRLEPLGPPVTAGYRARRGGEADGAAGRNRLRQPPAGRGRAAGDRRGRDRP